MKLLNKENNYSLSFIIYVFAIFLFFVFYYYSKHMLLFPPDDFTKDLMWSSYHSYAKMYPDSFFGSIVKFNPWIGYDVLLGYLRTLLGTYNTAFFAPLFFLLFGFFVFFFSVFSLRKSEELNFVALAIFALIYYIWSDAILNARPEALLAIFLVIMLNSRSKLLISFLIVISALFYSLFWLYAGIAIIVYILKRDYKLAIFATLSLLVGLLFWFYYAGVFDYLNYVKILFLIQKYRDGIQVLENTDGLFLFFTSVGFALILATFLYFIKIDYKQFKNTSKGFWQILSKMDNFALATVVALPGYSQARYVVTLFIIFAGIYIVKKINANTDVGIFSVNVLNAKKAEPLVYLIVLIAFFRTFSCLATINYKNTALPKHSRVIVMPMSQVMFTMPYFNHTVQIYPPCEIGFAQNSLKKAMSESYNKGIVENQFCPYMYKHKIKYFLTTMPVVSNCLKFEKIYALQQDQTYCLYSLVNTPR